MKFEAVEQRTPNLYVNDGQLRFTYQSQSIDLRPLQLGDTTHETLYSGCSSISNSEPAS